MNNKFIVTFDSQGANDTVVLGDSRISDPLSVSPHNQVSHHPFTHVDNIEQDPYANFFTLALPTKGWKNRLPKHDPTIEEQKEYFETTLNNIIFNNTKPFVFRYSLEYNEDMANIHCHGVIQNVSQANLNRFKKQMRKIFKLAPANRIAIKYYKTENIYLTEKYHYHLGNIDYNKQPKNKVTSYYTKVAR
jgi:hypothetical protein